jgi:hypothetical protein
MDPPPEKKEQLMIIGLSGYAGSGKDTAAEIIKSIDHTWEVKRFSEKLKQVAEILTGIPAHAFNSQEVKASALSHHWDRWEYKPKAGGTPVLPVYSGEVSRKPMFIRDFLQILGTDAVRNNLHEDAWVIALMHEYRPDSRWIITDVRFFNECAAIKEKGGIIVRVDRGRPVNRHPSETAIDDYPFDEVIHNNGGIDEYIERVKYFYAKKILFPLQ